jgi:hypothetical protein
MTPKDNLLLSTRSDRAASSAVLPVDVDAVAIIKIAVAGVKVRILYALASADKQL